MSYGDMLFDRVNGKSQLKLDGFSNASEEGVVMSVKRVLFLSSLLVAALVAQNAGATLPPMLPESSHYQGFVWYDEEIEPGPETGPGGNLRGRIDFAVYDNYGEEFIAAGYETPGAGEYIYAYQILNDYDVSWWQSEVPVAYFAALGIDMAFVDGIDSQEDPEVGVEPSDQYFSTTDGIWEFDGDWINAGGHSWFLAFSSNQDWVAGDYEIRGPEPGDIPVPPEPGVGVSPVPEPAMLTLLGIGGAILFKRRNKFV
jgi:hypothetical protein